MSNLAGVGRSADRPTNPSVDIATKAFTRAGWKEYSALEAGCDILTLNLASGMAEWQPLQSIRVYEGSHSMIRIANRDHHSVSTLNQRWPIYARGLHRNRVLLATSATVNMGDQLIGAAQLAAYPIHNTHSDAFVELVAWFWTEGSIFPPSGDIDAPKARVTIRQSERANPQKVERIEAAIRSEFGDPGKGAWGKTRLDREGGMQFRLARENARRLLLVAPSKIPSVEFLLSLTQEQLELFISVSLLGDGHIRPQTGQMLLTQKNYMGAERFADAVSLSGRKARIYYTKEKDHSRFAVSIYRQSPLIGLSHSRRDAAQVSREDYVGTVWCPQVSNGTWFAQYNGYRFFTGGA